MTLFIHIVPAHPKMLIGFACIDKSLYRILSYSLVDIGQKVKVRYIRSFFCIHLLGTNSASLP